MIQQNSIAWIWTRRSGPSFTQHPGDRCEGIPVSSGGRYPKDPIKCAEIADDLHVPPVQTNDEPVVPREDLQQPLVAGGKEHRHRWRRAWTLGQDAHEADDIGSFGLV